MPPGSVGKRGFDLMALANTLMGCALRRSPRQPAIGREHGYIAIYAKQMQTRITCILEVEETEAVIDACSTENAQALVGWIAG